MKKETDSKAKTSKTEEERKINNEETRKYIPPDGGWGWFVFLACFIMSVSMILVSLSLSIFIVLITCISVAQMIIINYSCSLKQNNS